MDDHLVTFTLLNRPGYGMWQPPPVILFIGIGAYLWTTNTKENASIPTTMAKNDIQPGGNKAVLKLSDGKKITLDEASNGQLASDGGSKVIKSADGKISYQPGSSNNRSLVYNTMSTPRGGQYQLILPDGSRVWLNAESSITYPTVFTEKERSVFVTGEAYFEVVDNKTKPFIVSFNDIKVQVLGTSFNVNAYTNESSSKTTLIEGAVKIVANNKELLLKPGQQAIKGEKLNLNSSPNIQQVLAWKNGVFNFVGLDFATCMRQLERWYDVEIVYDKHIPEAQFWGKIDKNLTLMEVIEGLSGVSATFRLEGKKLHVLP